jgi:hypothetical protein
MQLNRCRLHILRWQALDDHLDPQNRSYVGYELDFQFGPLSFDDGFVDFLHLTHGVRTNLEMFDRNSLFGVMSIRGRQLCVKIDCVQDLRLVGGPFQRGIEGFSG